MSKSIEQFRLDQARKYPFNGRSAADVYELAAQAVLADLTDRSGVKHELNNTDEDIKEEIVTSLAAIIRAAVKP